MTLSSSSSRNPSPSPSSSSLGNTFKFYLNPETVPHLWTGLRAACSVLPDCSTLAVDNVRRLAVNLYSDLLSRLVTYINRSLKPSSRQPCNIFLFDSPGFQNPSTSGDFLKKLNSLKHFAHMKLKHLLIERNAIKNNLRLDSMIWEN